MPDKKPNGNPTETHPLCEIEVNNQVLLTVDPGLTRRFEKALRRACSTYGPHLLGERLVILIEQLAEDPQEA